MRTSFRPLARRQPPADRRSLRNRGRLFRVMLDAACRQYAVEERALIARIPEPLRIVRATATRGGSKLAFFERKALPDYLGFLRTPAVGVAFDAKSTDH